MSKRIRARADVGLFPINRRTMLALTEGSQRLLEGERFVRLAPYLDGGRSRDQIAEALAEVMSPAECEAGLGELEELGLVCEHGGPAAVGSREEAAFWEGAGVSAVTAGERLGKAAVTLATVGGAELSPLDSLLEAQRMARSEGAELTVVVTDDYLREDLGRLNREHLREGRAWVLVRLVGAVSWIGPLFEPEVTACWECLAQRLRENRWLSDWYTDHAGKEPLPPESGLATTRLAAGSMAATEVAKWFASGRQTELRECVVTVDWRSLDLKRHRVIRRPQCPACGDRARGAPPRAVRLEPRREWVSLAGGWRTVPPEETVAKLESLVSPITGILGTLRRRRVSGAADQFVYEGRQNVARSTSWSGRRGLARPDLVMGKGATPAQAKASCLAEAVERYSAGFSGDEPAVRATLAEIGKPAVDPQQLLHLSESQYREREEWNRAHSAVHAAPKPFREDVKIDWTPAWSLTRQEEVYLPTAYCYFRDPESGEEEFCRADSNGCAAGNCLEEAILQGLLELIERDATAVWWFNRVRRPGVDEASFADPFVDRMRALLAEQGRSLTVLDLTHDLGVPTFAAWSAQADGAGILIGLGAHRSGRLALSRAVSELAQLLPFTDWIASQRQPPPNWSLAERVADHPYLVPLEEAPRNAAGFSYTSSGDLKTEVESLVAELSRRGLETLVVDLTRPDLGLPVVRVTIPGLRPLHPRFGPGRLFDVPVQLGWLKRPRREDELNPFPYPF